MTDEMLLEQVLEKYCLCDPVSADNRKMIIRSRRRMLIRVLKQGGMYSLFYILGIYMFFFLRRLGFGVSIGTAKVVAAVTAVSIGMSGAGSGVYVIKRVILDRSRVESVETQAPGISREGNSGASGNPAGNRSINVISYPVMLIPFTDRNTGRGFESAFNDGMKTAMGSRFSGLSIKESGKRISADIAITGSLSLIGDEYLVAWRIVDLRSGEIICSDVLRVKDKENIYLVCMFIAGDAAEEINKYAGRR